MKQLFTLLAFLLVGSAVVSAQTTEAPYTWQTWIYSNDSTRLDAGIPVALPDSDSNSLNNLQWRGVGQVVNLSLVYDWFSSLYSDEDEVEVFENLLINREYSDYSDEQYINQFRNAKSFTIDTIFAFIYSLDENAANNTETLGSFFTIMKSDYDFTSAQYRQTGFEQAFVDVRGANDENVLVDEEYLEPSFMAGQVDENRVSLTVFTYDEGELSFGPGESAILLFWNPLDPAYTFPEMQQRINVEGREDQRNFIFAQTEFRTGAPETQTTPDTRSDSLTYYKPLGLVLYRNGNGTDRIGNSDTDTLASAWQNLFYGGRRSLLDLRLTLVGTVELGESGVRYHFGRDAAEQGLGEVTPNPVSTDSRLPFALSEKAHVTIEVYSMSGEKVATLIDNLGYMEGNYSVPLPVSSLENGAYVVRMTANENVYTMKFTVAK